MLTATLLFFIQTLGGLLALAFLLRFLMQWLRVPFANPFAQFIVRVTDFAVRPARRVIPGFFGLDWASLLLAWLVEVLVATALEWLRGFPFALAGQAAWLAILGLAALELVKSLLYLLMGLVLVRVVLSWVNPYSPMVSVLNPLTEPLLAPFRRVLPAGQIDLSPLVLLILLQFLLAVPLATLEASLRAVF